MVLDPRGSKLGLVGAGFEGSFYGDRNVLYLDQGMGYMAISIFKTHQDKHVRSESVSLFKLHLSLKKKHPTLSSYFFFTGLAKIWKFDHMLCDGDKAAPLLHRLPFIAWMNVLAVSASLSACCPEVMAQDHGLHLFQPVPSELWRPGCHHCLFFPWKRGNSFSTCLAQGP